LKLSVFTVMVGADYDRRKVAQLLAETGYSGIEWRVHDSYHVPVSDIKRFVPELRSLSEEFGLEIPALATYLRASDYDNACAVLEAAAELGCPKVRIGVSGYDRSTNYHILYDRNCRAMAKLEPVALKLGVKAQIEIHMGNIACSPSLAHRILKNFDPQAWGAIFDPGNMVYEGYEKWKLGLELLGPWLSHVHVKNSKWIEESPGQWKATWAPMDKGIVNWSEVLSDLRAVGYDGYLSLEDFGPDSPETKVKQDFAYLSKLLSEVE